MFIKDIKNLSILLMKENFIMNQLKLNIGDAVFFMAGKPKSFEAIAARARVAIGEELSLTNTNRFAFAWIVDFPMYELDETSGKIDFSHNPFSMPQGGIESLNGNPLEVLGYQYDLTCNGYELLSGAIRNHKLDIMVKAFELAGICDSTKKTNPLKDKNLIRVAKKLIDKLGLKILLVTLGELGMLICQPGKKAFHIPTLAREVFDVSGAGDTVIGTFTMAIAAGADPIEAAILANHAAGVVVGKLGTATVTPKELLDSFN